MNRDNHNQTNSVADESLTESANLVGTDLGQSVERFAAVISQDLKVSLDSLTLFVDLLVREYQDELDETALKYLENINNSGLQMQTLLQDLQTYSQAGRSEQTWLMVDLNLILRQVTDSLQNAIAQKEVEIVAADLPCILFNPQEAYQLLKNLVENAIKFSDKNARIEINATKQGQEWLVAVADNGIGIAKESHLDIFQVFHRLHSADTYSGTGTGLAICHKIINRYGGRIWVESAINRGSTFYFTLPTNVCFPLVNRQDTVCE